MCVGVGVDVGAIRGCLSVRAQTPPGLVAPGEGRWAGEEGGGRGGREEGCA
jgi:hypothetical protein